MRVVFYEVFLNLQDLGVIFFAFYFALCTYFVFAVRSKNRFGLNSCRKINFVLYKKLYLAFLILFLGEIEHRTKPRSVRSTVVLS